MLKKIMPIIQTVALAALVLVISITCIFKTPTEFSHTERRALAQAPELTADTILSGKYMSEFESYATDQFPLRDTWRKLKTMSSLYIFREMDNNGYYTVDDTVSRLEYPLNNDSVINATDHFRAIYDQYLKDGEHQVFLSIIPDKNAHTADERGHLAFDYEALYKQVQRETDDFAEYIDITDLLSIEDYYATDTHWRQEQIVDVAKRLATSMGTDIPDDYTENTVAEPFYGVHYAQSALPFLQPDTIQYLTNDTIDGCEVFNYETQKTMPMYDMSKAGTDDAYELYLSGPLSLITIDNPNAENDKELIVFRDSFGSSIAPLLAQGYAKVTLVDIRYLFSSMLGNYVDFENADVLFLYSTLVLNNSQMMK